ncbi:MAG: hypothetical protein Q4C36_06200, partial [Coriobacteriia bacterium]|nr:hypothetical protein [Coriobacteriia bacterium]
MAELMDDVSYLSQEVGPRPAGTEEEQQAALYIADKVHQRTGFHAEIEDINCMANPDLVDLIYFAFAFVCLLLAFLLPVTSIVTFILSLLCAVLYVVENVAKKPIFGRLLTRDISQNVVVKYKPGMEGQRVGQPRKIVVVANYDSGRVRHEVSSHLVGVYTVLMRAAAIALVASPILILLRNIVLAGSLGVGNAVLSLLCVVALVLLIVPLVFIGLRRFSAFNEGANNNASSVAVMLEVLRRIDGTAAPENAPRTREVHAEEGEEPVVHGESAARAAGVVPEGVDLAYDDDVAPRAAAPAEEAAPAYVNDFAADMDDVEDAPVASSEPEPAPEPENDSAESRLRSAKAAIAALTGEAINDEIFLDFDENQVAEPKAVSPAVAADDAAALDAAGLNAVEVAEEAAVDAASDASLDSAAAAAATAAAAAVAATPSFSVQPQTNEPDWFTAARAKANRPADVPAKRSRYADALDAAVKESSTHFQQANSLVDEETEARLRQMRESFAPPAPEPAPEPVVEAVEETIAPAPEPEPVVLEQPEPSQTAAFPPVGAQGEVVAFEPEFDFDEDEPVEVVEPVEPEPVEP